MLAKKARGQFLLCINDQIPQVFRQLFWAADQLSKHIVWLSTNTTAPPPSNKTSNRKLRYYYLKKIGHGTAGFAFINPQIILTATEGKETGERCVPRYIPPIRFLYGSRRRRRRIRVPGRTEYDWVHYEKMNGQKMFVIGHAPNQILVICAGLTYWYRKIIAHLKEMVRNGEILTPEFCANFAKTTMDDPTYKDPTLKPGAPNIHKEYAEIIFAAFIPDGPGPNRRPSMYYCTEDEVTEIVDNERGQTLSEEVIEKTGIDFSVIGTGGRHAIDTLKKLAPALSEVGSSWRSYFVRMLSAMQPSITADPDSGGRVLVCQFTQAGLYVRRYNTDGSDPNLETAIQGLRAKLIEEGDTCEDLDIE